MIVMGKEMNINRCHSLLDNDAGNMETSFSNPSISSYVFQRNVSHSITQRRQFYESFAETQESKS